LATLYVRARTLPGGARRFDVKYRRGGRYTPLEHGGTFRTKREALIRRDLIGDLLAVGLNPKVELRRRLTPERPLREAAEGWRAARRRVSDRTRESYAWREVVILREFGDKAPGEILVEDVSAWLTKLERSYRPGSIRGLMEALRLMLDHVGGPNAARDRRLQLPRMARRQVSPPDAPAVLAMLGALSEQHVPAAVAMELLGTRVSETLSLERRDLRSGGVRVRAEAAKAGRSRLVPAPEFLVDALMERLPLSGHRQAVANAMRRAGGINPHALRHRRASLWYQQGVGPVELAERLGHARPSMSLDVYSHVDPLSEIPAHELRALLE
jgi:integrase